MNRARWMILGGLAAAMVVLALVMRPPAEGPTQSAGGPGLKPGQAAGQQAPDFTLPEYKSNTAVSLADYKGQVVLVNFWATWCPPCRAEIPDFLTVREELGPKGFEIVGISLDAGGAADIAPFAKEYGITYPVLVGNEAVTTAYGGIRGIPASFLVNRQGEIVQAWTGAIEKETLEQAVTPLL